MSLGNSANILNHKSINNSIEKDIPRHALSTRYLVETQNLTSLPSALMLSRHLDPGNPIESKHEYIYIDAFNRLLGQKQSLVLDAYHVKMKQAQQQCRKTKISSPPQTATIKPLTKSPQNNKQPNRPVNNQNRYT